MENPLRNMNSLWPTDFSIIFLSEKMGPTRIDGEEEAGSLFCCVAFQLSK